MSALPGEDRPDLDDASLAKRLRDRRIALGLTLKDVARSAGLSVGFISQIERGISTPSLASLVAVSRALNQPVGEFLSQPAGDEPITRRGDRPNYAIEGSTLTYERLSATFPGSVLNSVIIHEPPGHRVEAIVHEGEEMMFVLEGEITMDVGDAHTVLYAGDSVHFRSDQPHSRWNHTSEPAVLLWVGTLDVFGDRAGTGQSEPPLVTRRGFGRDPSGKGR